MEYCAYMCIGKKLKPKRAKRGKGKRAVHMGRLITSDQRFIRRIDR
jgi:hypothetical protein